MATTLPTFSQLIDDEFTHTWYKVAPRIQDNIIDAVPVWAALKAAGCMQTQVGGKIIARDVRYGRATKTNIGKTDLLPAGKVELTTEARWPIRYISVPIMRNMLEDRENQGEAMRHKLVETRLAAARDALLEGFETDLFTLPSATAETTDKGIQSLNEMVPPYYHYNAESNTYGLLARSNPWWKSKYQAAGANPETSLVDDMQALYMSCTKNLESPKLIITSEEWFRIYLSFGLDVTQVIKDEGSRLVDLGYEVARFNGKPMIYQDNVRLYYSATYYNEMLMLNTDYIEVVYDPTMWFYMTEFKREPLSLDAVAHILCAMNIITNQPRRHGRLYSLTSLPTAP